MERPDGISTAEMRTYTADRFKTYELMARTINKNWQPKNKNARPTNKVYGGAGLTDPTNPKPKKDKKRNK